MARKTISGLYQKGGIWQIDKVFRGERLQESTGTGDRQEAEQYLIHRLEKLRQERVYGIRRTRTWEEAATRFLLEYKDQPSIKLSAHHLTPSSLFEGSTVDLHRRPGTGGVCG